MNYNEKLIMWVWLSLIFNHMSPSAYALTEYFGNVKDIFNATEKDYSDIEELTSKQIAALCNKDLTEANHIVSYCTENDIGILTPESSLYPQRLRRIKTTPCLSDSICSL